MGVAPDRQVGLTREPPQLRRGKEFQRLVRANFEEFNRDGKLGFEAMVSFEAMEAIRKRRGRIDILITGLDGYVVIYEIKATDWDRIKPGNVRRNLYRHQKQLWDYINKYWHVDGASIVHGIIYPRPPARDGLREFIEDCLEERYSVPAYWYSEVRSE